MTKEQPEPGIGDVPLDLDGEEVILRPSLKACIGISRLHSAPYETAQKVLGLDFDTSVKVLALGLNQAPKQLEERLYRTGLVNVRNELIRFIHIVNNGGRPPAVMKFDDDGNPITEEGEEEGNAQNPSQ